jgi:5-methyltetrahydropteroyltriglutamate--homocysteine methyltransferase
MALATNLGYPRIGPKRELKKALEDHWSGAIGESELRKTNRRIAQDNWRLQREVGIDHIPSNDGSLYDHVLDTIAMVGAVPARFRWGGDKVDSTTYFAMARGLQEKHSRGGSGEALSAPAMEMTKWFDTNYHYIVPEFEHGMTFRLGSTRPVDEYTEARGIGIETRPVLLGPVSFLMLGKCKDPSIDRLSFLDPLLAVYKDVLSRLSEAGASWVQMDEPCLVLDLDPRVRDAYKHTYSVLEHAAPEIDILVATYFGGLRRNLDTALALPVSALHIDVVRAPDQLDEVLAKIGDEMLLSLGLVDGRNIWKTDLSKALVTVKKAVAALGTDRVMIAPSCSLLHSPVDLAFETALDEEIREWLAFARQKLEEIGILARAVNEGEKAVRAELEANRHAIEKRTTSPRIHNESIKKRARAVSAAMLRRRRLSAYPCFRRRPSAPSLRRRT